VSRVGVFIIWIAPAAVNSLRQNFQILCILVKKADALQERQTEYTPYASFQKWDFAPFGAPWSPKAKSRFEKLVHGVNMIA